MKIKKFLKFVLDVAERIEIARDPFSRNHRSVPPNVVVNLDVTCQNSGRFQTRIFTTKPMDQVFIECSCCGDKELFILPYEFAAGKRYNLPYHSLFVRSINHAFKG